MKTFNQFLKEESDDLYSDIEDCEDKEQIISVLNGNNVKYKIINDLIDEPIIIFDDYVIKGLNQFSISS
jgi:hypothetical protein